MPWVDDDSVALLTDLYELTMAASYFRHAMDQPATFELFVRELPAHRDFLIVAGIEDAIAYLSTLHFSDENVAYLRSLKMFDEGFLAYLRDLRFQGDVWAIPEGEAVFAGEPILQVTAPRIQAQIVETFLLNCLTFQISVASKAARIALACGERTFVDFSPRRDHGVDAALRAARAAYIGGAAATSNVLAGSVYGLPLSGTMAHSYVMSFPSEGDAFRTFARDFPGRSILLIDTYDTLEGARQAARVANELAREGIKVQGVRLDSGDVAELARAVRRVLDDNGQREMRIFASGDLDEYRIAELLANGAPIDAFGVGTRLGTSIDAPALGGVYKLVEDARGPQVKLAEGKATLPGRKQVYRATENGRYDHDTLALTSEPPPPGDPLLREVMGQGERVRAPESLDEARTRCRRTLGLLPDYLRSLSGSGRSYPVVQAPGLRRLAEEARRRVAG